MEEDKRWQEPSPVTPAVPGDSARLHEEAEQLLRDSDRSSFSSWPKPPDVSEVSREAQRLATQAIERAAHLHRLR